MKFTVADDEFVINLDSINAGLTQSEMQMWDNCPEKWYLRYNLMLSSKSEFAWATTYGGWIHAALEEFYSTKCKRWSINPTLDIKKGLMHPQMEEQYEYYAGLAQIQMAFYASFYKHDMKVWHPIHIEHVAEVNYRGVRLTGMIDMFVKSKVHGGYYVVDHKTSYKLDRSIVKGWEFRFQFMFYVWLAWRMWGEEFPVKGFFPNALKKPQLRRGVHESIEAFLQRVQIDQLQRPDNYLFRERMPLTKGALKRFEKNILDPKIDRLLTVLDPKTKPKVKRALVRNKNTDHCQHYNKTCQFLHCCQHGLESGKHLLVRRSTKHTELASESDADE